jgi:hypothetical protein
MSPSPSMSAKLGEGDLVARVPAASSTAVAGAVPTITRATESATSATARRTIA